MVNPNGPNQYDRLLAQLDQVEQTWNPTNPGEQVHGTVSEIVYVRTKDSRTFPMVLLADPSGTSWKVGCGRAQLRSELDRRKVQPGDQLAIRYNGQQTGKNNGRSFYSYGVAHAPIGPRDASLAFDGSREVDDDLGLIPGATSAPTVDGAPEDDSGFQR